MPEQLLPPNRFLEDGSAAGGWWRTDEDRVLCELCPRACRLSDGDRGFCFVRENRGGEMVLTTYGRSTGFCIDPIEKKPLNHFYPGTSVLSFGTAGCNLGCRFCQNWDISKSREVERLSAGAMPVDIAWTAHQHGCRSVAFTYNDPVIWAEYAIDTARECRELGIKTVAVTAGYITEQAREPFFSAIDAANVDLKAFTEEFYYSLTASHLQPVLDTISWLKKETDVWVEITNLIIPQANDSADELRRLCDWLLEHAGDDTPVHFTAFHPDYRMQDRPRTPPETLEAAHDIASAVGLKHVYTGNVHDVSRQSSYCPGCGVVLIERDWYQLGAYRLKGSHCAQCGTRIAGHFDESPGDWGAKRLPVAIQSATGSASANSTNKGATGSASANIPAKTNDIDQTEDQTMDVVTFDDAQRAALHFEASRLVSAAVSGITVGQPNPDLAGTATRPVQGAFVTLKRGHHLRACCGVLGEVMPLNQCLQRSSIQTATSDTRLPTISACELPHLSLDVSILHGFRKLPSNAQERLQAVEIGRDGLRIQGGGHSGLLLPNVATEQGWNAEELLDGVCRKAGLPNRAWRDPAYELEGFESLYFGGPLDTGAIATSEPAAPYQPAEVQRLAQHSLTNVWHHLVGSTPSYCLLDGPDGDVPGISLQVQAPDGDVHQQLQINWRPGMPLQTTLLNMTKNIASSVRQSGVAIHSAQQLTVHLAVFSDPAMHGPANDVDLQGFDPQRRALFGVSGQRVAWAYDRTADATSLFHAVQERLGNSTAPSMQVFSATASTTGDRGEGSNVPAPVSVFTKRMPAVAGTFYPADPAQLQSMVGDMIRAAKEKSPSQSPPNTTCSAAMVPHAGLIYSGQLAADVLSQLVFPETIIIIGPKHTRDGVDWAVAPHEEWQIPGHTFSGDRQMSESLAQAIDDLQLDEAAHRREHAIEVELPLLAQLAPQSKIVGIAIGSGDWPQCRRAAQQLAEFIKGCAQPPMLLISSDMNHFLDEAETRRRDELALTAIDQFDPQQLLETVRQNQISMCGVLPAVIVMETWRILASESEGKTGCKTAVRRVGYTTSALVSGDFDRVVGYAGVIFG
jgi:AmmeMemoRadiSam system radical SAM enzyme/AmmeMemoRadiSam system protein B/AmmeMemoRadiSam system protein A